MRHEDTEREFSGTLKISVPVTNREREEQGGFLYIHNIARAGVYWWLGDVRDDDRISERVAVVCEIAEPAEPADEPEVAVGAETEVRFPVRITRLADDVTDEELLAEGERVIRCRVAQGSDDFEGLHDFQVALISGRPERRSSDWAAA